jgi:hypothetical protein
MAHQL